jgi:hypothetical protein
MRKGVGLTTSIGLFSRTRFGDGSGREESVGHLPPKPIVETPGGLESGSPERLHRFELGRTVPRKRFPPEPPLPPVESIARLDPPGAQLFRIDRFFFGGEFSRQVLALRIGKVPEDRSDPSSAASRSCSSSRSRRLMRQSTDDENPGRRGLARRRGRIGIIEEVRHGFHILRPPSSPRRRTANVAARTEPPPGTSRRPPTGGSTTSRGAARYFFLRIRK